MFSDLPSPTPQTSHSHYWDTPPGYGLASIADVDCTSWSCSIHLGRASASSGCGLLSPSLLHRHNCTQFLTVMGILACTSCRSRKIACDRRQPACSRCLLSGKMCEFRARKSAKPAVHSQIQAFEARLGMSLRSYASIQRHLVHS